MTDTNERPFCDKHQQNHRCVVCVDDMRNAKATTFENGRLVERPSVAATLDARIARGAWRLHVTPQEAHELRLELLKLATSGEPAPPEWSRCGCEEDARRHEDAGEPGFLGTYKSLALIQLPFKRRPGRSDG